MAEDKRNNKIVVVLEESFKILGLALLSFIVLEMIKARVVLAYLNLNFLLLLWLAIGILVLVLIRKK
ncbi:MAG: hypothetical protein ACLFNO_00240 [Parcubacteria group bacterium]